MNCGLDFACHVGGLIAPLQAFWATWWPLGLFTVGLIIGGILGWRVVLAVLTLGVGYFLYDKFRPAPEPEYETGEPAPAPKPKKRKTILDQFRDLPD
jgi:hypothetical protein